MPNNIAVKRLLPEHSLTTSGKTARLTEFDGVPFLSS